MDRTICANESSRGRGFSASRLVDRLGLVGRPGEGAGSRLRGSRQRGRWFLRLVEEADVFLFHKNSGRGMPPNPRNDHRAPAAWARSAGAGSPDGARGPRATRPPPAVPPSLARLHPVSQLDPPPRGCRVPRPEARNRGCSYTTGGRVHALHAILRPQVPPNRPPNAQNDRESGFPGFGGATLGLAATRRPRTHPRADPQARAGHGYAPGWRAVEDHVGREVRHDGARGCEHLAARRSRGGPETPGSEGAQPPASLRRGLTECGPKGTPDGVDAPSRRHRDVP